MKYYAVIDTNVLVSAMLKWNSVAGDVMQLVFSGTIIPLFNHQIIDEYRSVLLRPKFRFTKDIVDDVISELERLGIYVDAESVEKNEFPDPKDINGRTQIGRGIPRNRKHQTFSHRTLYCYSS